MLTRTEALLVASFLEDLDNEYSNAGCNDLYLPNTPEMREVEQAAEHHIAKDEDREPNSIRLYDGKIGTNDQKILGYLRDKIMEAHGIKRKELVRE